MTDTHSPKQHEEEPQNPRTELVDDAGQPFDINEDTVDDPEDDQVESPRRPGRGDPSGSPFNINDNSVDDD